MGQMPIFQAFIIIFQLFNFILVIKLNCNCDFRLSVYLIKHFKLFNLIILLAKILFSYLLKVCPNMDFPRKQMPKFNWNKFIYFFWVPH